MGGGLWWPLGFGFGTWIWDLGLGLGLDNICYAIHAIMQLSVVNAILFFSSLSFI